MYMCICICICIYTVDGWDKETAISVLIHYTVFHGIFTQCSYGYFH